MTARAAILPPNTSRFFLVTIAAISLGAFLLRLGFLERRGFNPDELQHLHNAWSISKGLLPYRDYFEHHTPWLHLLVAPFFALYEVETDPDQAARFLFFARRAMWLSTGLILWATFWVGRSWADVRVGALAVVFLGDTIMFLAKTLEFRPDVPATACLMLGIGIALSALKTDPSRRPLRFASSGFLLGAAVLFTQKMLFAIPGLGLALGVFFWNRDDRRTRRRGIRSLLVGFTTPLLLTLVYFAIRGGLGAFVEYNFLINARWEARVAPWGVLEELLEQNPVLVGLAVPGWIVTLGRSLDPRTTHGIERVPVWTATSLLAGLFVIPVPHRQYALAFLPVMAIVAARWLVEGFDRLARSWTVEGLGARGAGAWGIGVTSVTIAAALAYARPTLVHPAVLPLAAIVAGGLALGWLRRGRGDPALGVVAILLSLYPVHQSRVFWERRSWSTVQNIAYVLQNTTPGETVLDGFSGLGVFRPHAFFYFFLHDEVRLMVGDEEWTALARGLEEGTIAPKLVLYDRHLQRTPPAVRERLLATYLPIGREPLRFLFPRRGGRWSDDGKRPLGRPASGTSAAPVLPYVLVEDGWHLPDRDRGRAFRASRGRRSRLRVPVREPRDFIGAIRARLELDAAPVEMELAVNGRSVGSVELALGGWREYTFRLPGEILRAGLNDFLLTYSKTPYQLDPQARGRNETVSVESLTLLPTDR